MSTLKQCPRGHFYEGDVCPYCPTQYYPNSGHTRPTRTDNPNPHKPTFKSKGCMNKKRISSNRITRHALNGVLSLVAITQ